MNDIYTLIKSFFAFYISWSCYSYYTGRVNLTVEKEKRREYRVQKYGTVLILCIIISAICGFFLLFIACRHLF